MNRKGRVIIATFACIVVLYASGFRLIATLQTISSGKPYFYKYGPFTGRVVDMDTGKPIEGALVYLQVSSSGPYFGGSIHIGGMDGTEDYTFTDENGLYRICRHRIRRYGENNEETERAYRFYIYKKGYVCYHLNSIFPCNDKRTDFRWENNLAKLEPWRDYYTYTDHLNFVPSIFKDNSRNSELEVAEWEIYKREIELSMGRNMLSSEWAKLYKDVSCSKKIKAVEKHTNIRGLKE